MKYEKTPCINPSSVYLSICYIVSETEPFIEFSLNPIGEFFIKYLLNKCNYCKIGVSDTPILFTDANDFVSIHSVFISIMLWVKCDVESFFF